MTWWQACGWGLLGAGLIEVRGLWSAIEPSRVPKWPWKDGRGRPQVWGYVIAVACRFVMAVGLNAVYAASHQIAGPLGAVTMGIAAPLIIQQMAVRGEVPAPASPPQNVPPPQGARIPVRPHVFDPQPGEPAAGDTPGGVDVR